MPIPLDLCRAALLAGDGTALMGIADSLADVDDPRAAELSALAQEIFATTDPAVQQMAALVFLRLLESRP